MLIEANVNVDQKDFAGQNALHYAVKGNYRQIFL
jgi:ankyrin repeat protein